MNYIILNNEDYFKNRINLNNFKKVDIDGSERIDAIFAEITKEILESTSNNSEQRDQVLRGEWLLKDGGVQFMVLKIDRSILYDENEQLIEKMFGLFSKEHFFIELWNFNIEESYNQLECFLIAYNKNFGYKEILESNDSQGKEVFEFILKKIEEKIL